MLRPPQLALTADNQSRVYGAANPTSGTVTVTTGSLYNGDALGHVVAIYSRPRGG